MPEIEIIESQEPKKAKAKAKKISKPKPNPLAKYGELNDEIVKVTRRKRKKGKPEHLTEAQANERVLAAVKLLVAAGFKSLIGAGTLMYDGTTFAQVTCTSMEPVKGSWIVTACITRSVEARDELRISFSHLTEQFHSGKVKA